MPKCYRDRAAKKQLSGSSSFGIVKIGGSGGSGTPRCRDPYGWEEWQGGDAGGEGVIRKESCFEVEVRDVEV